MKVIIAGGRDLKVTWPMAGFVHEELAFLEATEVVSGACPTGADRYGENHAKYIEGLPVKRFPADWTKYGKPAGPMRNEQMAGYADACILLPGGSGTADMKSRAIAHGLIVREYKGE